MAVGNTQQRDGERVQGYLRELQQLESIRFNWETYWLDIARRVHPNANVFTRPVLGTPQAERRTEYIFESTAPLALDRFAAAMESMLFPRTQRWHRLVPVDPRLRENRDIRAYLEDVTDALFAARYAPRANFASQAHENMLGLGAFGTGALFVDEEPGSGVRYKAVPLQDLYIGINHAGVVDRVFRKFEYTAVQAAGEWGKEKLPESVVVDLERAPHKPTEWLQVVKPRMDQEYGRRDYRGMAWESCYLSITYRQIVAEGGYRVFPYAVSRYTLAPREYYGRSPAMLALADIKMLNEMSRTDIEASHMAVRPPLLVPDDDNRSWSLRPGALNYGAVTADGKALAIPFNSGVRPDIAEQKMESRRKSINDSFLVTLFQILVQTPEMTATEALLRAQEKGALLTPTMGRQQSEFLGPLIERELDILGHAGQLPPMPPELMAVGGAVKIEYSSPLNRLQRADDGVGIMQTIQQLAPLAEGGHPEVFDIFDPEATARELADINGVPARVLRSPEELQKLQAQKAQQAQVQALINAAPQAAAAAKDLSDARATALNNPPPQPGVGQ